MEKKVNVTENKNCDENLRKPKLIKGGKKRNANQY